MAKLNKKNANKRSARGVSKEAPRAKPGAAKKAVKKTTKKQAAPIKKKAKTPAEKRPVKKQKPADVNVKFVLRRKQPTVVPKPVTVESVLTADDDGDLVDTVKHAAQTVDNSIEISDLKKRISDMESRLVAVARILLGAVHRDTLAAEGLLPVPQHMRQVNLPEVASEEPTRLNMKGIEVGWDVWVAYTPKPASGEEARPLRAKVVGISTKRMRFSVKYYEDDTVEDVPDTQVFPYPKSNLASGDVDVGLARCCKLIDDMRYEHYKKQAYRGQLAILMLGGEEGDLTVERIQAQGHKAMVAMAGMLGLNPRFDIMGKPAYESASLIVEKALKFQEMKGGSMLLANAKASVEKWEAIQEERRKRELKAGTDIRAKARALRLEDELNNGRQVSETFTPLDPRPGDVVQYAGAYFRIRVVKRGRFYTEHAVNGIRKVFHELRYLGPDTQTKIPQWEPSTVEGVSDDSE